MGTRLSIGRFTLKAPVGRSMEASSGRFEIEAPVGRLMAASSGRYLTGAPVGHHHKASSGRSCQVAPIGRCHQASNGRFNLKAPTGRFHGASNGRFQGEAANGHAADPQCCGFDSGINVLPRLSSPSSFHLVQTGLKPSIGRFRDASWTLLLDNKQIRPVRGQPQDGSQAAKFWTTNGRPEVRPLVVRRDPWWYTAATFRRPEGAGWAVPPSLFDPALNDVKIAGRTCAVKVTARRRQLGGLVSRQWGAN
ncbi:hypothetical protein PCANC_24563 [Puccinia coronata f. sp. avenae]|uniref:Uncharacterized protein n=1 Tax=Puccinia coronata f. sp. avenae TaxID=200324 RepID=A0A2N5TIY5_9BASI|nr:hypothetical protein PCANC_24563 [Puccinia coronata f. sp. avenae]